MTSPRRFPPILLVAAVFLFAFNLRPALTTVGPVLTDIGDTFGLNGALLGLLGALPVLTFGVMSLVASTLTRRIGIDRLAFFVLLIIAGGIIMRSVLGLPGLWVGTTLAAAAIAIGNVLGTVLVRRDFARHAALATGIFTAVMGLAASIASGVSAPIAQAWGWEMSLGLWAIPPLLVALLWIRRAMRPEGVAHSHTGFSGQNPAHATGSVVARSVWRRPDAWWLTLFMGMQSSSFYFLITWLPAMATAQGATADEGGGSSCSSTRLSGSLPASLFHSC